jgi:hypothetical protein
MNVNAGSYIGFYIQAQIDKIHELNRLKIEAERIMIGDFKDKCISSYDKSIKMTIDDLKQAESDYKQVTGFDYFGDIVVESDVPY